MIIVLAWCLAVKKLGAATCPGSTPAVKVRIRLGVRVGAGVCVED